LKQLLSPRQFAQAIGVSESSIKRWCDQGRVETVRTAGGHRRIPISAALKFLRHAGERSLVDPEALGISGHVQHLNRALDAEPLFREALLAGDETTARQIVFELYVRRHPIGKIGDEVVAAAMREIGDLWECGTAEVYQERLACEICLNVFRDVRTALPAVDEDAPVAMCATPGGDPYEVAVTLVELVLRESGWNVIALGSDVSLDALAAAVQHHEPQLVCLSVSAIDDEADFGRSVGDLRAVVEGAGGTLILGGRAIPSAIRRRLRGVEVCDTLGQLASRAIVPV